MDSGSLADWLSALANVAVGGAAAFAAYQGYLSLSAWRDEAIGKRRIELAEDVLAEFYEARDLVGWARSSLRQGNEAEDRPGREQEPENERSYRDDYYVVLKRFRDEAAFFSRLHARRYRVIATFGATAAEPFDEIQALVRRVQVRASTLMRTTPASQVDPDNREKWENIIFAEYGDPDPIAVELNAIIEKVESCFAAISRHR